MDRDVTRDEKPKITTVWRRLPLASGWHQSEEKQESRGFNYEMLVTTGHPNLRPTVGFETQGFCGPLSPAGRKHSGAVSSFPGNGVVGTP